MRLIDLWTRWTCIYPIYLDAKRPYGTGQRRISRAKSLWWPQSKDITEASIRLGLGAIHEVQKSHPRDWENPGRVRVGWKKNGQLVNPNIKTSMCAISMSAHPKRPHDFP
jgi:signal recognition particle subunit SRP19